MKPVYFAAFALLSLWDYYIPGAGGRVLDYVALLIMAASLMPFIAFGDWRPLSFTRNHFLLMIALAPPIGLAVVGGYLLTAAALLVGYMFVQVFFFAEDYDFDLLSRQIGWLIVLNLIAFYVQYAVFQLSGFLINYHSWIGAIDPRTFNAGIGFFRAAGLYQEPNSFCTTLFMLSAIRLFCPRQGRDVLFPLSVIALMISESLWGIGAAFVLTLLKFDIFKLSPAKAVVIVLMAAGGAALTVMVMASPLMLELLFSPVTVARLLNPGDDASAALRFSGAGTFAIDWKFFVGHGPNTEDFQFFLGANGISFYIYGFGIVGLVFFLLFAARTVSGDVLRKVLIVVFVMTTYPLFTYGFWWAWLAILFKANPKATFMSRRVRSGKTAPIGGIQIQRLA